MNRYARHNLLPVPFRHAESGPDRKVSLHDSEARKPLGWHSENCLRRVGRFLINSEFTRQRFADLNPRIASCPHAIVPLGLGETLEAICKPFRPPAALMLGSLMRAEAYKGHYEVLAAWPRVPERVPGAELWIVGGCDLESRLLQAVLHRRGPEAPPAP